MAVDLCYTVGNNNAFEVTAGVKRATPNILHTFGNIYGGKAAASAERKGTRPSGPWRR